jgi:hypothetical protein
VPQHASSDLVKLEVFDIARDDRRRRVRVAHVGDVRAFLSELRQRVQNCRHLSLRRSDLRALLRDFRALLRWMGGGRIIDDVNDDVLDMALQLPNNVN